MSPLEDTQPSTWTPDSTWGRASGHRETERQLTLETLVPTPIEGRDTGVGKDARAPARATGQQRVVAGGKGIMKWNRKCLNLFVFLVVGFHYLQETVCLWNCQFPMKGSEGCGGSYQGGEKEYGGFNPNRRSPWTPWV